MTMTVYLDKCEGIQSVSCKGLCIRICALNAITNINNRPSISEELCSGCGLCASNCPNKALSK